MDQDEADVAAMDGDDNDPRRPKCACGKTKYTGPREAHHGRRGLQAHRKSHGYLGRLITYRCEFGNYHVGHK